jgi:hypothetical protein
MSINSVNGLSNYSNYQTNQSSQANQTSQTNQSSDSKGGVGHKGGHHPHNHKKSVDSVSFSQEGLQASLTTQNDQTAQQTEAEKTQAVPSSGSQTNLLDQLTTTNSTASTSNVVSNDTLNKLIFDIENALSSQSSNKNTSGQSSDTDNDGDQK